MTAALIAFLVVAFLAYEAAKFAVVIAVVLLRACTAIATVIMAAVGWLLFGRGALGSRCASVR
jgi:hypothetical protein